MSDGPQGNSYLSTYQVLRRECSLVGDRRLASNPPAPVGNCGGIDVQELSRRKIELGAVRP